ncbi:MAG: HYExAFE family protein [Phycisphaerales bacterium]
MAQRRHHYELAFEHYLRDRRIPYVAVDEARKALLPDDPAFRMAPPDRNGAAASLKSFDFVLYGRDANLLIEIKGRKIARRVRAVRRARHGPPSAGRLESWVTEEDVDSLLTWERLFGDGFRAAFVFVYWCDELPAAALFEEVFEFRGRWYAIRAVPLSRYAASMKPRSRRWRTVHVSSADFDRISTCLCGRAGSPGGGALQHDADPVASASVLEVAP